MRHGTAELAATLQVSHNRAAAAAESTRPARPAFEAATLGGVRPAADTAGVTWASGSTVAGIVDSLVVWQAG